MVGRRDGGKKHHSHRCGDEVVSGDEGETG
jgi:hypothetical protein